MDFLGLAHLSPWGITFVAVDPSHQRQGLGSMLIQSFCGYVDENALDTFLLYPHLLVFHYFLSSDLKQSALLKQSTETLLAC